MTDATEEQIQEKVQERSSLQCWRFWHCTPSS
ncbi:Uncharacterised protein [Vibrio cholerae]|nr:Uncharacterised protein [Vibrio cholerae]